MTSSRSKKKKETTTTTKSTALRVFLNKILSKLKNLGTNFPYKAIFTRKMSKFDLMTSASENESNGTGENETSTDEYLSDFLKLQQYMYSPCVSKESLKENCPRKTPSDSEEDTVWIGNILWCSPGKYKPMATQAENICCLNKYKIRETYFKGIRSFTFEIFLSSNLFVRSK